MKKIWEEMIRVPEIIRRLEPETAELLDNLEELIPPTKQSVKKDWIDTFLTVLQWGKECQNQGLITDEERQHFMQVLVRHRCI